MKSNKDNNRMVYSTNPEYNFEEEDQKQETLTPNQQKLYVSLDKKQRKGKKVTLIKGFVGSENDLKDLAKKLKASCGVGGSSKEGEIILQGDFRNKVKVMLEKDGFTVKLSGI